MFFETPGNKVYGFCNFIFSLIEVYFTVILHRGLNNTMYTKSDGRLFFKIIFVSLGSEKRCFSYNNIIICIVYTCLKKWMSLRTIFHFLFTLNSSWLLYACVSFIYSAAIFNSPASWLTLRRPFDKSVWSYHHAL